MAVIGGRRPISWRLSLVVSFVAAYATARWLEGIFGAGDISGTLSFLVLVGGIAGTWWINRRAATRENDLLGSARFGDRSDVRKLETSGDLLIGRSGKSGKPLRYDGSAHLLTMAPTRSGKGVGTIIPNLLLADRAIICVDPKGENARITARARAAKGPVWCLDPFGVSGRPSARYNPLDRLDPDGLDLAEDANTLADALVHDAPGQAGEAHWNEEAKALIAGLILHAVTHEPADRRTLATVRDYLTLAPAAFAALLALMQHSIGAGGLVSRAPPTASSARPIAKPQACCRPRNAILISWTRPASSPARPRPTSRSPISRSARGRCSCVCRPIGSIPMRAGCGWCRKPSPTWRAPLPARRGRCCSCSMSSPHWGG